MIIIQELDKQIEALEKQSLAAKKKKEKADALADCNGLQFGKVTILQNNEQRTQYTPTIKLLKRDPAEVRRHNDNRQANQYFSCYRGIDLFKLAYCKVQTSWGKILPSYKIWVL